jgi:hypothetical protein
MNNVDLLKKIEENDDKETDNRIKLNIIDDNKFETTAIESLGFSFIVCFIIVSIIHFTGLTALLAPFLSSIPVPYITLATLGASFGIGEFLRRLKQKIFKDKEKLKSFSKAKTEYEKYEEEVSYKIENRKLLYRTIAIKRAIDTGKIVDVEQVKGDMSAKRLLTKEELADITLSKLNEELDAKDKELGDLTTKQILNENFKLARNFSEKMEYNMRVNMFALFTLLPMILPNVLFEQIAAPLTPISGTLLLGVVLSAFVGSNVYFFKKIRNTKKLFNKLNSKLGEKGLSKKISFNKIREESESINYEIANTVNDMKDIIIKIESQKEYIKKLEENDNVDALEKVKVRNLGKNITREYEEESDLEEHQVRARR